MSIRNDAFSAVRWTTSVTIGRVLLQTLQIVVLARLISPHDFGLMAMILSVTAFIQLFADLGVSTTIIYTQEISIDVLSTLYWLNVFIGGALSALLWIASPYIASFYESPELMKPLALTGSAFLLLAIGQQFKVLAEKRLAFKSIAIVELISATLSTSIAITAAAMGAGVYSLVAAIISLAAGNSLMYWLFVRDGWLPQPRLRLREAAPNIRSGLMLLGTSIFNTITVQADVFIVGRLLGSGALGLYTVPRELCLKVMFATNPIVTRVGTPLLARAQCDQALLRKIYLKTIRMISAVNFPLYGAIAVFRHEIVEIVLGPRWAGSADLLGIMAIWGMFRALGNPIGTLLYGTGNPRLALMQSLSVAGAIIPTVYIGSFWGTSGVAVALTLFYFLFVFAVWYFLVNPILNVALWEYTKQWATPFVITFITAGCISVISPTIDGTMLRLVIGCSGGLVLYTGLSWLFNREWYNAMLGLSNPRRAV